MKAAGNAGHADAVRQQIRELVSRETAAERFVTRVLGPELALEEV
jgi:hypothetical protein